LNLYRTAKFGGDGRRRIHFLPQVLQEQTAGDEQ
jgi:hypothetical protein